MSEIRNVHGAKEIIEVRVTRELTEPGEYSYDAQAVLCDMETMEHTYVRANRLEGNDYLCVCNQSVYADAITEDDSLPDGMSCVPRSELEKERDEQPQGECIVFEQFYDLDEASGSEYYDLYVSLLSMIQSLEKQTR